MKNVLIGLALAFFLGSCNVNKDILFKTPNDYVYDELPDSIRAQTLISPNNIIRMDFYTGDGHVLIESGIGSGILTNSGRGSGGNINRANQITYLISQDGTVKLPVLGRVKLAGLSIREAERKLEKLYSKYYNEPFVILKVSNNRVIVSPGSGGNAQVIILENANTTLMEALALAGGIDRRGIASEIKLIRKNKKTGERDVYKIDLSTIAGLEQADMIVQPEDIIYVEPLPMIASGVVKEIAPFVALLTTAVLVITLANNL